MITVLQHFLDGYSEIYGDMWAREDGGPESPQRAAMGEVVETVLSMVECAMDRSSYEGALAMLPCDAVWSSTFGAPGDGGYCEYWRQPDGTRWVITAEELDAFEDAPADIARRHADAALRAIAEAEGQVLPAQRMEDQPCRDTIVTLLAALRHVCDERGFAYGYLDAEGQHLYLSDKRWPL